MTHPFEPVCGDRAHTLILGTFPSVRSRAEGFYYGHPRNRFWPMLAAVYGEPVPADIPAKRALILAHGLALWDVLQSCEITGSADASIRAAVPNDIAGLAARCGVRRILANGQTAGKLCRAAGFACEILPSTSPANAAWSLDALTAAWGRALRAESAEL